MCDEQSIWRRRISNFDCRSGFVFMSGAVVNFDRSAGLSACEILATYIVT